MLTAIKSSSNVFPKTPSYIFFQFSVCLSELKEKKSTYLEENSPVRKFTVSSLTPYTVNQLSRFT